MQGSQDLDAPIASAFEVNRQMNDEFYDESGSIHSETKQTEEVETNFEFI